MCFRKSVALAAALYCGPAVAQESGIDLSRLPQGYTFESIGPNEEAVERFLYAENGDYFFEKTYFASSDQPYVTIIKRNVSGQTVTIELPSTSTYYYFPHDCFAQRDLCAFNYLSTPEETRPQLKGYNNYSQFYRGVWIVDHFSSYQNGLKISRDCYTLDEFGLRLDWMSFELNFETFDYDLLVDWEARTVPKQQYGQSSRLAHIRNTCLFDAALS